MRASTTEMSSLDEPLEQSHSATSDLDDAVRLESRPDLKHRGLRIKGVIRDDVLSAIPRLEAHTRRRRLNLSEAIRHSSTLPDDGRELAPPFDRDGAVVVVHRC